MLLGYTSEWDVCLHRLMQDNIGHQIIPMLIFLRLRFGGGGNFQTQTKYPSECSLSQSKTNYHWLYLPIGSSGSIKIKHLRLYITGQNLFTFTSSMFKNFDPEYLLPMDLIQLVNLFHLELSFVLKI